MFTADMRHDCVRSVGLVTLVLVHSTDWFTIVFVSVGEGTLEYVYNRGMTLEFVYSRSRDTCVCLH